MPDLKHTTILKTAIKKAIDSGWRDPLGIIQFKLEYGYGDDQWHVAHTSICVRQYSRNTKKMEDEYYQYQLFIYTHDFAKALWGERTITVRACGKCDYPDFAKVESYLASEGDFCPYDGSKLIERKEYDGAQPWAKHLQQMVIAEDPIQYLGENI